MLGLASTRPLWSTSFRGCSKAVLSSRPFQRSLTTRPAKPAFFFPSHRFHPFFAPSFRSFSSAAFAQAGTSAPRASAPTQRAIPKSLPNWLLGCSALVFGILVVGGLTRLTESGLSIVEWNLVTGIRPPITQAEWDEEWEKYKVSPEGVLMNSKIEMSEFKKIFYMEWAHRIGGRMLGLTFAIPAVYYMARYRLPRGLPTRLVALGLGIGAQGVIGWYMVKSGLEQEIIDTKGVPRVSQYRLAAHLSAALALYIGMLSTALSLRRDLKAPQINLNSAPLRRFKGLAHLAGAMVFLTAVSGAFVAGLDAGLVYNEFPTMGGKIVPDADELFDKRYAKSDADLWWRNIFENPVTAQFDHRLFATTTFGVLLSLPLIARVPSLRKVLPRATRRITDLTAVAAVSQVTLGITTLLYLVPIPLAAMHQAGSVVLLTCLTALGVSLRRPRAAVQLAKKL
ncbi:putative cytochrome c oxidase biogenesis-related protein [Papiliotrema laurentii]|uniref:Cytochrome c oxidase biogenesis-related protein n=1 Tax=Papiliotrema laurentii TaxID=5418 RepID=A0AAD9CZE1_PAPLA|nr:putative cytochrome c oxidase biogenesis-related protein [Papiliotrema laurentii]